MRLSTGILALFLIIVAKAPAVAQTIEFVSFPSAVGSGLQSSAVRARLSTSQHGGVVVTLASSDSTLARVAPDANSPGRPSIELFIPNGSTDALFIVQGMESTTGTTAIDASAPGFTAVGTDVEIETPVFDIVNLSAITDVPDGPDLFRVRVGLSSNGSSLQVAQAARVGGGGLSATITVSDPGVAELVQDTTRDALVVVPVVEGSTTSPNSTVTGVALDGIAAGTTQVIAQIPGFVGLPGATQTVTVSPAALSIIGDEVRTGSGLRSSSTRVRLNGSAHGGTDVSITVSDASLATVSADTDAPGSGSIVMTIPDGQTDATFYFDGAEGQTGSTFFDVSAPGFGFASGTLDVEPVAVEIRNLGVSQDTLDPFDSFYGRIGITTNGTTLSVLSISPGGTPIPVTFAVDDSTIARLRTQTLDQPEVTLEVPAGSANTPTQFSNGGIALDGIAAGTVEVTARGAGLIPITGATVNVTVSEPSITPIGLTADVGAGLVSSALRARLGATQHGGTTVRVESLDPSRVLLSLAPEDTGQAVVEGFVADGSIDLKFYVHGIEGNPGTGDVNISAPQFGSAQSTVDVVVPAIQLRNLGASQSTIDGADAFYARIGLPNGSGVTAQARRPGAGPLTVTFSSSDTTVATLVTSTTQGSPILQTIPESASNTPIQFASGGIVLDGLAPGTTTVTARTPGFTPAPTADQDVTVEAPTMSFVGASSDVGTGLQTPAIRVRLGGSQHGGTPVTVTSSDPASVAISEDAEVAGSDTVEVFVPDGSIDALVYVQAYDGALGQVALEASAPGFAGASYEVEIVQPAVEIRNLGTSFDVGDPIDAHYVRIGVPNSAGTRVGSVQSRRPGGSPIPITVSSDDGAVAELVGPGGSGPSQVIPILAGQMNTPTTVAAGGFGLRPLAAGNALVTASAPGFLTTGGAQVSITVSNSGIALAGVPFFLGGGLQTGELTATLADRFHGGVVLRIESSDSTRARVAPEPDTPGTPFLEIALPNGTDTASYVIQGVSGTTGSVSIDATAGTESGGVALEIVAPALQFVDLADSLDVVEGEDPFVVQTGIASADGDSLVQVQDVSAIGAPLDVSLVNTLASSGDLVTSSQATDSLTVPIQAGRFQSAFDVDNGGVEFDPRLAGTTSIVASAPGFASTPSATFELVVFGDLTDAPAARVPFALRPNVPNPFNPSTTLQFSLPLGGRVQLVVYDVRGRRVRTLVDEERDSGVYSVKWQGKDDAGARVASGVYFARLVSDGKTQQQKMVLVQ